MQRIVEAMNLMPAMVLNARLDVQTTNAWGQALFAPALDGTTGTPNMARYVFLILERGLLVGVKLLHHPVVGELDLPYESLPLAAGSSSSLVAYAGAGMPSTRRADPPRELGRYLRHRSGRRRLAADGTGFPVRKHRAAVCPACRRR